jgi:hypothetical protein
MTSLAQTQQHNGPAEDSRDLAWRTSVSPAAHATARGDRETLPAVDPSKVFGCVDWFLYPEPELRAKALAYQARG